MNRRRLACALSFGLLLAACGSSTPGGGTGGGGGTAGTGGGTGGGSDGGGGAAPVAPQTPNLEMVMPMASVLHVEWSTPEPCDQIEAERKDTTNTEYVVAFTVDGTKSSHMDGQAYDDLMYTYRLRC